MTVTAKVLLVLSVITAVASVPIINNVATKLNNVPIATPINVPTALKKVNQADKSEASAPQYTLYFIALEDNGTKGKRIGCNDSVVPISTVIKGTNSVSTQEKLETLLQIKSQYYENSGLYNSLYQSDFKVSNIKKLPDGSQQIFLTGSPKLGGVCDIPRVIEQLTATAQEGNTNKQVSIYINNKPIESVLSQK